MEDDFYIIESRGRGGPAVRLAANLSEAERMIEEHAVAPRSSVFLG